MNGATFSLPRRCRLSLAELATLFLSGVYLALLVDGGRCRSYGRKSRVDRGEFCTGCSLLVFATGIPQMDIPFCTRDTQLPFQRPLLLSTLPFALAHTVQPCQIVVHPIQRLFKIFEDFSDSDHRLDDRLLERQEGRAFWGLEC